MASSHTTLDNLKQRYLHNIQVYLQIPEGDIKLLEFEELALNRFYLLKIFDTVLLQGCVKYSSEWEESVLDNVRVKYPNTFYKLCEKEADLYNPSEDELLARQIDHISHFILRTVCCNDIEFHQWFINQEADWLHLRYKKQNYKGRELFLKLNCLNYEEVSDDDKKNICNKFGNYSNDELFYKLPFKQALKLIKKRKVRLYKGYAYVPSFLLIDCIIDRFKSFLYNVIFRTKQNMTLMNEQQFVIIQQILKILKNELAISINKNLDNQSCNTKIKLTDLNKQARKNFPLCMKHLYDTLKEDHHLKYGSRLQLGNFLKSIGLSLENSLAFWKTEFTYKITEAAFQKDYSYSFKHMYGKVGKMKSYRAATCRDIINETINIEEAHGCPFKTWDSLHLTRKLQQYGCSPLYIDDIEGEILNQQYEKACGKFFQLLNNQAEEPRISSPSEYFQQSLVVSKNVRSNDISSDEDDNF